MGASTVFRRQPYGVTQVLRFLVSRLAVGSFGHGLFGDTCLSNPYPHFIDVGAGAYRRLCV